MKLPASYFERVQSLVPAVLVTAVMTACLRACWRGWRGCAAGERALLATKGPPTVAAAQRAEARVRRGVCDTTPWRARISATLALAARTNETEGLH